MKRATVAAAMLCALLVPMSVVAEDGAFILKLLPKESGNTKAIAAKAAMDGWKHKGKYSEVVSLDSSPVWVHVAGLDAQKHWIVDGTYYVVCMDADRLEEAAKGEKGKWVADQKLDGVISVTTDSPLQWLWDNGYHQSRQTGTK